MLRRVAAENPQDAPAAVFTAVGACARLPSQPKTRRSALAAAAGSPHPIIRQQSARHANTAPAMLIGLSADPDPRVRSVAAARSERWLAELLASDTDLDVRCAAVSNPNIPQRRIEMFARSSDIDEREAAARNTSAAFETLRDLVVDHAPEVVEAAAANPTLSQAFIEVCADKPRNVSRTNTEQRRCGAISNPAASAAVIEKFAASNGMEHRLTARSEPVDLRISAQASRR